MVKLYTWTPTTPEIVWEQTVAPDLGHAALEVIGENGLPVAYASFWPERDSLIGLVTGLWKKRQSRGPAGYAQETDPEDGFMQRPADYEDEITGLNELVIVRLWQRLETSEYDFLRWNCASVCKILILSALPAHFHSAVQDVTGEIPAGLARLTDWEGSEVEELQALMRDLSFSPFLDSHPEELRRIAQAFLESVQGSRLSSV